MGKVFISYSHEDEEWKNKFQKQLKVLVKEGVLSVWDDRKIKPGMDWLKEIKTAIREAEVAVLLISDSFLTSDFILEEEVPELLERRESEGIVVIPLILKPCNWNRISWLNPIQGGVADNKALSGLSEHDQDLRLSNLTGYISDLINAPSSENIAKPVDDSKEKVNAASDSDRNNKAPEKSSIDVDDSDTFKPKLLKSLEISIQTADLAELPKTLAKYLKLETTDIEPNTLIAKITAGLLERGFHSAVQDTIYKTCQFFLTEPDDLSVAEKCDPSLSSVERQRLTQAISEIMGLLALYELDENVFKDDDRLQKVDSGSNYFIAQGISTPLGVELLLRRMDSSDRMVPDIKPGNKEIIELKGQAVIQPASRKKWSKKGNVEHALIDIWNSVEDYEDPEGRYPRRNRDEKLDEDEGELEQLNEKIAHYRDHKTAPRCFFIAERLNDSDKIKELCGTLSEKLPELTAIGFRSKRGTSVFLKGDMKIRVAIESIYKQFGFCAQQRNDGV